MIRRVHLNLLILVAVFATVVAPRTVLAGNDEGVERGRRHFERGVERMHEERWGEAVAEFRAAESIRATAPLLYNLGISLRELGRHGEALETFERFLTVAGDRLTVARRDEVRTYIDELETKVGHVLLKVSPETARVRVDGRPIIDPSMRLSLDPGLHVFTATAATRKAFSQTIYLEARQREITLSIELAPLAETPSEPPLPPPSIWSSANQTPAQRVSGPSSEDEPTSLLGSAWFWVGAATVVAVVVTATALSLRTAAPYEGTLGYVTIPDQR